MCTKLVHVEPTQQAEIHNKIILVAPTQQSRITWQNYSSWHLCKSLKLHDKANPTGTYVKVLFKWQN